MSELINLYRANPTDENAIKLRDYHREQPLECCMFTGHDVALIRDAIYQANIAEGLWTK
jgi:hypothetical protein